MLPKIFILIVIDQVAKIIFRSSEVKNFGLSFSINLSPILNLALVILGLSFFFFYYWRRRKMFTYAGELIFVLIFAGAISNIIDRIYFGYVRDFIDIGLGFTFNLADVFIVIGLAMFLFLSDRDKYQSFG